MLRDYENMSIDQEQAESVVFEKWFDWLMEQKGISLDTQVELSCGIRKISDFRDMFVNNFPCQEAALSFFPGVAAATDSDTFLVYLKRSMENFHKTGVLV